MSDVRAFEPERLARAFPRIAGGGYRLNTTRALRRFDASEVGAPHRRLLLVAWTPGAASLVGRPDDRGRRVVTIGLETRATEVVPFAPERWRAP